jgi:NitT/TauT family transport system substrate-binding protein
MAFNRRTRWLRLASILLLTAAGLQFSACQTAAPAGPDKVMVGIVPYVSFAPFFIAKEEGYFAEQNLALEFVTFETGSKGLPALEQGQVDVVGEVPVAGLFNAINQTGNIKIIAERGYLPADSCDYFALLASKDWLAENPNPTADAIRGKRLSVDLNSFQAYATDQFLNSVGLSLDDVDVQYLPSPSLLEAAKNGSIDFITTAEPWVTRLVDTGSMAVLTGYQKVIPDEQLGIITIGRRLAVENPDLGKRFMTAYLKGVRQYNLGKTDRNVEIIAQYTKLEQDLLRRICWPSMRNDGKIDFQPVMDFQNWAMARGQLDAVAAPEAFWDPQFLDAALKTLGTGTP